jgi:hypothetical protein
MPADRTSLTERRGLWSCRCARIGPPSVLESLDTLLIEALTEQEADAFYAALDV